MNKELIIKDKYKDYAGYVFGEIVADSYIGSDNRSRDYWKFKNITNGELFTRRIDNVMRSNRKDTLPPKWNKGNRIIHACGERNYAIVYFSNYDGFFLISETDVELVSKYTWCTLNHNRDARHDPITNINGKMVRLTRLLFANELADAPSNIQVDHINGIETDCRRENLRLATPQQNNWNRSNCKQGRVVKKDKQHVIIDFPFEDVSGDVFELEVEARMKLHELQDKYQGEYGFRHSQEMALANSSCYFNHIITNDKTINDIQNGRETVYKHILRTILMKSIAGNDTENTRAELEQLKAAYLEDGTK